LQDSPEFDYKRLLKTLGSLKVSQIIFALRCEKAVFEVSIEWTYFLISETLNSIICYLFTSEVLNVHCNNSKTKSIPLRISNRILLDKENKQKSVKESHSCFLGFDVISSDDSHTTDCKKSGNEQIELDDLLWHERNDTCLRLFPMAIPFAEDYLFPYEKVISTLFIIPSLLEIFKAEFDWMPNVLSSTVFDYLLDWETALLWNVQKYTDVFEWTKTVWDVSDEKEPSFKNELDFLSSNNACSRIIQFPNEKLGPLDTLDEKEFVKSLRNLCFDNRFWDSFNMDLAKFDVHYSFFFHRLAKTKRCARTAHSWYVYLKNTTAGMESYFTRALSTFSLIKNQTVFFNLATLVNETLAKNLIESLYALDSNIPRVLSPTKLRLLQSKLPFGEDLAVILTKWTSYENIGIQERINIFFRDILVILIFLHSKILNKEVLALFEVSFEKDLVLNGWQVIFLKENVEFTRIEVNCEKFPWIIDIIDNNSGLIQQSLRTVCSKTDAESILLGLNSGGASSPTSPCM
jgi:hypothetical protein